jgi:hypothetical protein
MRILSFASAIFVIGLFLFAAACSKSATTPPPPIAVEETPAKLEEAFKQNPAQPSNNDVQILLDDAVASLKAHDYGKALFALQALLGRSDLTAEQRDTASRSMLAANKALADQASSGDRRAQEVLQLRRATK